jgi:Ca2+-binding RTX toxin-like protein
MHWRMPLAVVTVGCATVMTSGAALAATVVHPPGAARVDVVADLGETNVLTVTINGTGELLLTDRSASSMGVSGDCTAMFGGDPAVVACPTAGVTSLELSGGDMDDELTNTTSLPVQAFGEDGHDTLRGGSADDRLDGGPGPDDLNGGSGNDRLYGATLQSPGAGTDADVLAGGPGDDRLFGSGGADQVDGGPGADQLEGAGGADIMQGGDGRDGLVGGDGDDTEDGGTGDDAVGTDVTLGVVETSQELGNDALRGGPGNDTLIPGPGPPLTDADTISGGDGFDRVNYGSRMTPVDVSKDGAADDGGLTERDNVALDVERVTGGLASDTLVGGPDADTLEGGAGDDTVDGLAGDDTLLGDAGTSEGTDIVRGGPGADNVQGEGGGDSVSGDAGNDTVQGGAGTDTLSGGPDADQIVGGPARDVVAYSNEPNVRVSLDTGSGATSQPDDNDRLSEVEDVRGGDQRDTLTGSNEANALVGRAGEDYVDGLRGVDQLEGGRSADVVVARDRARDEPVSCGPGRDLAIVDRRDRVVTRGSRRCERVDDGSRTKPRPGRVYVHPQRCGANGVELGLPAMHRLVPLRYSILLPSGYRGRPAPTLDASLCRVRVTATPGQRRSTSADVSGGAVTVAQSSGRRVATTLKVKPPRCAGRARTSAAAAARPRLRVKTRRRPGRWRVMGRFSIGASVGTDWTTVESCSGTTTIVRRGRVRVFDRVKHRTVTVRAGDRYVAGRATPPG